MDKYGLIGYPVEHSLSPVMHNAAFRYLNMRAKYELFSVEPKKLEEFLLNRTDVKGFNITIPHKVKAKEILETKFPCEENKQYSLHIKLAGAVNTARRVDDKIEYLNTDIYGFWESLKRDLRCTPANKNVLLIGCGGAGRAIIASLFVKGTPPKKVYIFDKDKTSVETTKGHFLKFSFLKDKLEFITIDDIKKTVENSELLINATPIGMKGDTAPIDTTLLHKDMFVYDVVYNRETELVKHAKAFGIKAVGGLGMLLHQGAKAFEFWTDRQAPVQVMKEALEEALKNREP
ncbi:MAG: shikimate dehydrogenase [Candidatus Omnitrophota bacterium]